MGMTAEREYALHAALVRAGPLPESARREARERVLDRAFATVGDAPNWGQWLARAARYLPADRRGGDTPS
jgi:hypothetical protein